MEKLLGLVVATLLTAASAAAQEPAMPPSHMHHLGQDSAFTSMQARGKMVMGVDQSASTHHFDSLPDGGRIELQANGDDTVALRAIRRHLRGIARAFAAGDFSSPMLVHAEKVPGTGVMAERRASLRYTYNDVPRGGAVRIRTRDPQALAAVHEFLAFQRKEHRASGTTMPGHE